MKARTVIGDKRLPPWAIRLRTERERRGWNKHEMARQLHKAAGTTYPPVSSLVRQILGWEKGEHFPRDWAAAFVTAFGMTTDDLFPPAVLPATDEGGEPVNRRNALQALSTLPLLTTTAIGHELEARERRLQAERTDLGPGTIDALGERIDDYAVTYPTRQAQQMWPHVLADRQWVSRLLSGNCTLVQRRELYGHAATLATILGWLAHDQGHQQLALACADDAYAHAREAERGDLVAWAADATATVHLYNNRYDAALSAALDGSHHAPEGTPAATRLHGQVVRTHARLGHRDDSRDALKSLLRGLDRLPPVGRGLFAADAARVLSVTASAASWLAEPARTRAYADQALQLYADDPASAPTRMAIAQLDRGLAAAQLGDADEAADEGRRALSTPRPADAITKRGRELARVLTQRYPGSHAEHALHAQLRSDA